MDQARTKTAPFPGRYPTRWRILFHGKTTDWQVITKPNPLLINLIKRVARHAKGVLEIQEFDRAGVFRYVKANTPRKLIGVTGFNPVLIGRYYPWEGLVNMEEFFWNWQNPVYSKLIKLGKQSFFVYSSYEVMWNEAGFQRLRDYRTWLKRQNRLK